MDKKYKAECDKCKSVLYSGDVKLCCVCNQFLCEKCRGEDLLDQGVDTHICSGCCKTLIDADSLDFEDFELIAYRIKDLDIPRWQKQDVTMFFYVQEDGRHGGHFTGIEGVDWSDSQLERIAEMLIDTYWQGHEDHYDKVQMRGSGMKFEDYGDEND